MHLDYIKTAMGSARNIKEYNMNYKRRGKAVIFCHVNFQVGLSKRAGAELDSRSLENALVPLGFEVEVCCDFKLQELKDKLKDC